MRVAVFFTPPANHPLTVTAAQWLLRDAFSGEGFAAMADDGFDADALMALVKSDRRVKELLADKTIACESCVEWNTNREPFRVFGNTYYVGTAGLSSVLVRCENSADVKSLVNCRIDAAGGGLVARKFGPIDDRP